MRVDVNKPGSDDLAFCIDGLLSAISQGRFNGGDLSVLDGDIGVIRCVARAVINPTVLDDNIVVPFEAPPLISSTHRVDYGVSISRFVAVCRLPY